MTLIKRLIAFARLDSYLCRRRQTRALEVLELVFPSRPLHIQLAAETGTRAPQKTPPV